MSKVLEKEKKQLVYRQISEADCDELQKITKLLVEFDERTGRYKHYKEQANHYARKAIAEAGSVNFIVSHIDNFVYSIIAEIKTSGCHIVTAWIHEDGIRVERIEQADNKQHPVHNLVCVSDLFDRAVPADMEFASATVHEYANEVNP